MDEATKVVWYCNTAISLCLLARLYFLRMQKLYKLFALYLFTDLLTSLFLWYGEAFLKINYGKAWLALSPVRWFFYIAIIYTLMQSVMGNFPGLLKLSKRALVISLVLALALAALSGRAEIGVVGSNDLVLMGLVVERAVTTASLLLLLFTASFLMWFPIQLSRNVVIFTLGYLAYFGSSTLLLLARNLWPGQLSEFLNLVMMIITTACYAFWLLFLSKAGEAVPIRVGHRWNPDQQEKLLGQLDAINASLLKSARRS